jgi:hypothetical protein
MFLARSALWPSAFLTGLAHFLGVPGLGSTATASANERCRGFDDEVALGFLFLLQLFGLGGESCPGLFALSIWHEGASTKTGTPAKSSTSRPALKLARPVTAATRNKPASAWPIGWPLARLRVAPGLTRGVFGGSGIFIRPMTYSVLIFVYATVYIKMDSMQRA